MPRAVRIDKLLMCMVLAGMLVIDTQCCSILYAAGTDLPHTIVGTVQNQDLRRVAQVLVEVKNQEGTTVATGLLAGPIPSAPFKTPTGASTSYWYWGTLLPNRSP